MVKILLAEDHKILREGIKSLLKDEPAISVVAEARNGNEAIQILSETDINIAILDINMPGMDGIETARYIKGNFSDTQTMILSMMDDENYLLKGFEAGARGYLLKSTGRDELLFAINKIANGGHYICSEMSYALLEKVRNGFGSEHAKERIAIELSDRELQILELLAEGLTNAEIGDKICASRRTVETYRKNLIDKTNSKNTASLIKFAITNKMIGI
jgi:DNA-binding NarL/FixJ family response regulator